MSLQDIQNKLHICIKECCTFLKRLQHTNVKCNIGIKHCLLIMYRNMGVGTGPADPAAAGPKFAE